MSEHEPHPLTDALETRTARVQLHPHCGALSVGGAPARGRMPALRGVGLEDAVERHLLGDAGYTTEELIALAGTEQRRITRYLDRLHEKRIREREAQ